MLLISLSIISSGCIEEPKGAFCVVLKDGQTLSCRPTDEKLPRFERPIDPGDQCVSPEFFGDLAKHHKDLHREIENKDDF